MRLDRIDPIPSKDKTIRAVVETPKGSRHKYSYEAKIGLVLRKSLPEGMVFPFDFGFVPGTLGEDGDPLDILVLADSSLFPGCVVDCNIIGLIEAEQQEDRKKIRNDRFVAVAAASLEFKDIHDLKDLPPHILKQTE